MHTATKRNDRLCARRLQNVTTADLVVNVSLFLKTSLFTEVGDEDCGFMA
jgi:hypothetical protein